MDTQEIRNRLSKLSRDGTTQFTSAELGKRRGYAVIAGRENHGNAPTYLLFQCGDPIGKFNISGAVAMIEWIMRQRTGSLDEF